MFNKNNQTAVSETVKEYLSIKGATIQAAHMITDKICVFTLNVPGASFMNLKVIDGKNGLFIAMPQQKGRNDQYYDQYRIYLTDEDTKRVIDAVGNHCTGVGEKADFKTRHEV